MFEVFEKRIEKSRSLVKLRRDA